MAQVESALCSANQLGTKYPSVPTVTSWYRHALRIYLGGTQEPETTGWGRRSCDKLAKPLRWFQLKLAALPVGFINSELAQTLTGMRELSPPGQRSPLLSARSLPSLRPILRLSFQRDPLRALDRSQHSRTSPDCSSPQLGSAAGATRKVCASLPRRNTCSEKGCKYLVGGLLINILLQCHRCRWNYFVVEAQHTGRQETTQSKYEAKQKHIERHLLWSCTDGQKFLPVSVRGLHKSRKGAAQKWLISSWNCTLCRWYFIYHVLHASAGSCFISGPHVVRCHLTLNDVINEIKTVGFNANQQCATGHTEVIEPKREPNQLKSWGRN